MAPSMFTAALLAVNAAAVGAAVPADGMIRLSPAAQTGLFRDVGQLNPHAYRPNEFFASDLVYEGLVRYDRDATGAVTVVPALATSWWTVDTPNGRTLFFSLRQGVTFHDGMPWNAAAAVLNLNNVLALPLRSSDWHGWFELPAVIRSWFAQDEYTLGMVLDVPYEPALIELAYIRPLRFLSPASFSQRSPNSNSCPRGWGNVTAGGVTVECDGILAPIGTGPYQFSRKVTNLRVIEPNVVSTPAGSLQAGESVQEVVFQAFPKHWAGPPSNAGIRIPVFASSGAIRAALESGDLDVYYGMNALSADDFRALARNASTSVVTAVGPPITTRMIVMNSAAGATSSLAVRQAIIASINKQALVRTVLGGLEAVSDRIFPRSAPNCDVDLFPAPVCDTTKAMLLLNAAGWTVPAGAPVGTPRASSGVVLNVTLIVTAAPTLVALAHAVRADLMTMGFSVMLYVLEKDAYNDAVSAGNFSLAFTESWGIPYDPHATAAGWRVASGEPDFAAQQGMGNFPGATMTKRQLDANITAVLRANGSEVASGWARILTAVHDAALYAPLSASVNVAVVSRDVSGFRFGVQQFDIPVRDLRFPSAPSNAPSSSSTTAVIVGSVMGPVAAALILLVVYLIRRERLGRPVFSKLLQEELVPAATPSRPTGGTELPQIV